MLLACHLVTPVVAQESRHSISPGHVSTDLWPTALTHTVLDLEQVARIRLPAIDSEAVRAEDEWRASQGLAPRYAIPHPVRITPDRGGTWEAVGDQTRLWRLRITCPGARSINLGFTRYHMPHGGRLFIYATDFSHVLRPLTDQDNEPHGQLWTPVVLSDDIIVELTIPESARERVELELGAINHGYRFFGAGREVGAAGPRSGSCNIDVVCPDGDAWRDEIPSVGLISAGGSLLCSGFMVNNTAQDQRPFFITAEHCGIGVGNAASLVVYWNFESPICGQQAGGLLDQWQTGSTFRAAYTPTDITLVELDDAPDPVWNITFAGWDRSGVDPSSAVAIHHPSLDEKSISFENDPCSTTSYVGTDVPGDGTHLRVTDWDQGTTEGGSSGSPLFDQNHHVVGQLHGGYAACGNDSSDWYGRFSVSWDGGGTPPTRLRDWLDPIGSGNVTLDTLVPDPVGLRVSPRTGLSFSGDPGGPFTPNGIVYTLQNQGTNGIEYTVTASENWIAMSPASGYLPGGASTNVTVSINANANLLGVGTYSDLVKFTNTTDYIGNTTRVLTLDVGGPRMVYSFPMDTNPGWFTQGLWAFGRPTGQGGQFGWPDPTSGYTGVNVYGYNLNGDYENNISQRHLTTTPIDCTGLTSVTLKFRRWLGLERSQYDHGYVRVSNDGINWTTVWENSVELYESSWSLQELDISATADNQPSVQIRWTLGPTDGNWQYCGWNIDDVEIWATVTPVEACGGLAGDMDEDGDVDAGDIQLFVTCYTGGLVQAFGCSCADMDGSGAFEAVDVAMFVDCLVGGAGCP